MDALFRHHLIWTMSIFMAIQIAWYIGNTYFPKSGVATCLDYLIMAVDVTCWFVVSGLIIVMGISLLAWPFWGIGENYFDTLSFRQQEDIAAWFFTVLFTTTMGLLMYQSRLRWYHRSALDDVRARPFNAP